MEAETEALLGTKIGNYVLTSLLGAGGMGAVYLAEHPTIGRRVAIKLLARHMGALPGFAERFIAEAKAVTRIKHPNVIEIYDFGQLDDGQLYYVMEALEGRELSAVIEANAPMPPAQIYPFVEQICSALGAAHESGVVHRDLKPENIFVLGIEPVNLKILDFGLAKLLESDDQAPVSRTATGIVMGTPLTIAPEQAAGQPDQIGPHTDLYSLGVILFWMLAGQPPFHDSRSAVLLAKHITEAPPPLAKYVPGLPPPIVELVEACLEKMPEDRPASAATISDRFRAGLSEAPCQQTMRPEASSSASAPAAAVGATLLAVTVTRARRMTPGACRRSADTPAPTASKPSTPRLRR